MYRLSAHLGSGQFGQVSKGVWKNGKSNSDIAVKNFTPQTSIDKAINRVRLLQEAIIMGQFSNPNVIHFYGMVIAKDTVSEYIRIYTYIYNIYNYIYIYVCSCNNQEKIVPNAFFILS